MILKGKINQTHTLKGVVNEIDIASTKEYIAVNGKGLLSAVDKAKLDAIHSGVPADAKFTDTVYDDTEIKRKVAENTNAISAIRTLKSVSTTYQASESDTKIPTRTWFTTIPKLDATYQYLWTKIVYTYSDGSTETSHTVATTHSGIQIGGRNLFLNSSLSENLDRIKFVNNGYTPDFTTEDGFKCLHVAGKNSNNTCYFITSAQIIPKLDDVYTITADFKFKNIAKGDSTTGFSLYGFSSNGETQDGIWKEASIIKRYNISSNIVQQPIDGGSQDWKRMGVTYRYGYNPTINILIGIYFRNFTGDVYVKNIKLERGNIPTDWTPAPEDLEAYTDTKVAEINNTLSTYAKKTDVPTKVSQLTNDSGYLTAHQDISSKADISSLAAVATSGSYKDLKDTPTIQKGATVYTGTTDTGYETCGWSNGDIYIKVN